MLACGSERGWMLDAQEKVSDFSAAAGLKSGQFDRKRNFGVLMIVGIISAT
jgi:hypothetical protein